MQIKGHIFKLYMNKMVNTMNNTWVHCIYSMTLVVTCRLSARLILLRNSCTWGNTKWQPGIAGICGSRLFRQSFICQPSADCIFHKQIRLYFTERRGKNAEGPFMAEVFQFMPTKGSLKIKVCEWRDWVHPVPRENKVVHIYSQNLNIYV